MKRCIAILLSAVLLLGTLAACGDSNNEQAAQPQATPDTPAAQTPDATTESATPASTEGDMLTLEFYNVAANYHGIQTGWFHKVVMDRFNMEMNIIAPQVAGSEIYQARSATGILGDLVILDATDFVDCINAGLIKDISDDIKNYPHLMEYWDQIDNYNSGIDVPAGAVYGIPTEMTNTSPTTRTEETIYSSPLLRWDLYSELGMPEINDLDGLLDVLADMREAHPTNADGDPAYPFTLWPDWDNNDNMMGLANVVQLTTWYGDRVKESAILKPDNTFIPLTDKTGGYYKILRFLNSAYHRGLVDPDSGTQNWDNVMNKITAGQVYLLWYSWQVGFWNSIERQTDGSAFIFVPVKDQYYYADSDPYYGSGRLWGVGAHVEGEKYERIMEFLDWYASPESIIIQHCGIEGFNYEYGSDGRLYILNDNALMDNLPVPAEWGGGGFQDGNNAINQWIVAAISTNPNTGEPYNKDYWSTFKEATMTQMKTEWAERFGAAYPVEYMRKNNVLLVSPNVSVSLPSDTPDISVIRNQCNETTCDYSWRMIFADSNDFDDIWDEMTRQLEGFGFDELYNFDVERFTIELNAKLAAVR